MDVVLLTLVVALSIALGATLVLLRRQPVTQANAERPPTVPDGGQAATAQMVAAADGRLANPWTSAAVEAVFAPTDLVVVPVPDDPQMAIVFGDLDQAASVGDTIGPVPQELLSAIVGLDAVVKLGIEAGQQAGLLVRLTPESSRKLRELSKMKDASGAIMAVLKDSDGQFAHVIRFNPATGLQVVGGVTGLMAAMAMQAQLAAIERTLADVSGDVRLLQRTLDMEAAAEAAAVEGLLGEVYLAANATGYLTESMWNQLAPIVWVVRKHEELADRRVRMLTAELATQNGLKERRSWLKRHGADLTEAFGFAQHQGRISAQLAVLRLWHLTAQRDPSLPFYVSELNRLVPAREDSVRQLARAMDDALATAATVSNWDRRVSPFDSRGVGQLVSDVRRSLALATGEGANDAGAPLDASPARLVDAGDDFDAS